VGIFEPMRTTPLLSLALLLASCGSSTAEKDALKVDIENTRRAYEGARQELLLKKDSAKKEDRSADTAFQARLKAAAARATALKQESGRKKRAFRALKQATHPRPPSPNTQ